METLHSGYATRRPPTGSAQPAVPLPHAPSPRACSRSSEPVGTHARSRVVPSPATLPPPARCEKSMPASSIPQTWYACLSTLPHLGITGSPYYKLGAPTLLIRGYAPRPDAVQYGEELIPRLRELVADYDATNATTQGETR